MSEKDQLRQSLPGWLEEEINVVRHWGTCELQLC